jgi:hypothetical protein
MIRQRRTSILLIVLALLVLVQTVLLILDANSLVQLQTTKRQYDDMAAAYRDVLAKMPPHRCGRIILPDEKCFVTAPVDRNNQL